MEAAPIVLKTLLFLMTLQQPKSMPKDAYCVIVYPDDSCGVYYSPREGQHYQRSTFDGVDRYYPVPNPFGF